MSHLMPYLQQGPSSNTSFHYKLILAVLWRITYTSTDFTLWHFNFLIVLPILIIDTFLIQSFEDYNM